MHWYLPVRGLKGAEQKSAKHAPDGNAAITPRTDDSTLVGRPGKLVDWPSDDLRI